MKRGSSGRVDFIAPLPCPFNYGSVPAYVGREGDLLDAVVLGPRIRTGTTLRLPAWGAITLTDRGMSDEKVVCSATPLTAQERTSLLRFFAFYARCKALLNVWRGRRGRNACDGWCSVEQALAGATRRDASWGGAIVPF